MTTLTHEQAAEVLATVERDGYAVVPGVIPPEEFGGSTSSCRASTTSTTSWSRTASCSAPAARSVGTSTATRAETKAVHDMVREHGLLEIIRLNDPTAVDRVRVTMNFNLPTQSQPALPLRRSLRREVPGHQRRAGGHHARERADGRDPGVPQRVPQVLAVRHRADVAAGRPDVHEQGRRAGPVLDDVASRDEEQVRSGPTDALVHVR